MVQRARELGFLFDQFCMERIANLATLLCSSGYRDVRFAAVMILSQARSSRAPLRCRAGVPEPQHPPFPELLPPPQLMTSWVHVMGQLDEARETAQKQLQAGAAAASKAKGYNQQASRLAHTRTHSLPPSCIPCPALAPEPLRRQGLLRFVPVPLQAPSPAQVLRQLDDELSQLRDRVTGLMQAVYSSRFRDVDERIRAEVISSVGGWIQARPQEFLQDTNLRYLAWALSDKQAEASPRERRKPPMAASNWDRGSRPACSAACTHVSRQPPSSRSSGAVAGARAGLCLIG